MERCAKGEDVHTCEYVVVLPANDKPTLEAIVAEQMYAAMAAEDEGDFDLVESLDKGLVVAIKRLVEEAKQAHGIA